MNNNYNSALAKQKGGGEWEAVGYIYQSDGTGMLYDQYLGLFQLGGNGSTQIPSPSTAPGFALVGWYHIHPDTYTFENGNGLENGSHFSPPDQLLSITLGVPGYVAEYNDVGPTSGDPSSDPSQESFQWYKFTPINKSGTESSMGTLTSKSGC